MQNPPKRCCSPPVCRRRERGSDAGFRYNLSPFRQLQARERARRRAGPAAGADLDRPLRIAGLTRGQIDDENARIGATVQIAFVQTIADMPKGSCWGSSSRKISISGGSDRAILRRLPPRHSWRHCVGSSVSSGVGNEAVQFSCVSGRVASWIRYRGVARHSDRHQGEPFLAALLRVCRQLTGQNLTPVRALLSHVRSAIENSTPPFLVARSPSKPKLTEAGAQGTRGATACRRTRTSIRCWCEFVRRRSQPEGPNLPCCAPASRNITAPILPHGKPLLSEVAQQLHISQRTLARRLAAEGLSLPASSMKCVYLALRYLQDRSLSYLGSPGSGYQE